MFGSAPHEAQPTEFDPHSSPLVLNSQRTSLVSYGTRLHISERAPAPADALAHNGSVLVTKPARAHRQRPFHADSVGRRNKSFAVPLYEFAAVA